MRTAYAIIVWVVLGGGYAAIFAWSALPPKACRAPKGYGPIARWLRYHGFL